MLGPDGTSAPGVALLPGESELAERAAAMKGRYLQRTLAGLFSAEAEYNAALDKVPFTPARLRIGAAAGASRCTPRCVRLRQPAAAARDEL